MKMELIESSETSAISTVTPGNYPKENILQRSTCRSGTFTNTNPTSYIVPRTNTDLYAEKLATNRLDTR